MTISPPPSPSPNPTPSTPNGRAASSRAARRTVIACVAVVAGMVGAAYASVPLYELFCKVTGYGGTPRIAGSNTNQSGERAVTVRFDANVSPALGWRFEPEQATVQARLGETVTIFYKLRNTGSHTTTGIASFNVLPELTGGYFNKIQCFCFSDITLKPGESMDAPVVFFIDPKIDEDKNIKGVPEITLSYSFFPSKAAPRPVAEVREQAGSTTGKPRL